MRIEITDNLQLTDLHEVRDRIVITADLHIDDYSDPTLSNPKSKFSERINVFLEIISYAAVNDISSIYILGDVLHSRTKVSIPVLYILGNIVKTADSYGVKLIALKGNHDSYLKNSDFHSLAPFSSCVIIDKVTGFKNLNIVAIPYGVEGIEKLDLSQHKNVLFLMHTEFEGAVHNGYRVMNSEMKPSLFKDGCAVLTGHYHKPQFVSKNVYYVGSPLQQNFGEKDNDNFFYDCLLYEDKIVMLPVRANAPKYYYIDFDKEIDNIDPGKYNDNYVRVYASQKTYDKAVKMFSRDNLSYRRLEFVIKDDFATVETKEFDTRTENYDVIGDFLRYKQVPEKDFAKYKEIGEKILNESKMC